MPVRSASPMSAEGLIAALREAAQAPAPVGRRRPTPRSRPCGGAAIQRLAALAKRARVSGPLGPVAAADPSRWWGAAAVVGRSRVSPRCLRIRRCGGGRRVLGAG